MGRVKKEKKTGGRMEGGLKEKGEKRKKK